MKGLGSIELLFELYEVHEFILPGLKIVAVKGLVCAFFFVHEKDLNDLSNLFGFYYNNL